MMRARCPRPGCAARRETRWCGEVHLMGKLPSSLARPRGALSGRVAVWPCAERAEGGLGARERRITIK